MVPLYNWHLTFGIKYCWELFLHPVFRASCLYHSLGPLESINEYSVYPIRGGARILKGRGLRFHIDASCMCIVPYVLHMAYTYFMLNIKFNSSKEL